MAYAIGRRVGNAVTRNRLRRQLRQIVVRQESALRPAWYLIGVSNTDQLLSWQALSEATATALGTVHRRLDHPTTEVAR